MKARSEQRGERRGHHGGVQTILRRQPRENGERHALRQSQNGAREPGGQVRAGASRIHPRPPAQEGRSRCRARGADRIAASSPPVRACSRPTWCERALVDRPPPRWKRFSTRARPITRKYDDSSHITLMMPNASARPNPSIHVKYHIVVVLSAEPAACPATFRRVPSVHRQFSSTRRESSPCDLAAQHVKHPPRINHDQRDEDEHDPEHDLQRQLARHGIPYGQAVARMARRRQDERKHRESRGEDDAGDRGRAGDEGEPWASRARERRRQDRACERGHRRDHRPRVDACNSRAMRPARP